MFQDGQLFAHRTVGGNVAYGLPRPVRRARRGAARARRAGRLRGPRRSRPCPAASASASPWPARSRPAPRLLLLDEPLSALDRALRERLAVDLRAALVATGTTAVFVTHDQDEAFAVADRVAVMAAGRLLQVDAPADLWVRPASREVASFLGYEAFVPLDSPAAAPLRDALDVAAVRRRRSRSRKARSSSGAPASPRAPSAGSRRDEDGPRSASTSTGSAWSPRSGPSAGGGPSGDVVELGVEPDALAVLDA